MERRYGERWPANFILSHGAGCERVGTKRVRGVQTRERLQMATAELLEPQARGGTQVGYRDATGSRVEDWRGERLPVAELGRAERG